MIDASTSMRTPFKAEHLNTRSATDATFFTTVAAAERLLGFTARVNLEEGLRRLVAWRERVIRRQQREHYDPHYQAVAGS